MLAGGTCRNNSQCPPLKCDHINLPRECERGTSKRHYNRFFHIFATQWKYSQTLQFISSLRKLEKKVTQCRYKELITVQCPKYITEYQHNMYGIDRGYQLCQHSADFSAKDHFKKWYKRRHFGICNVGLMNSHIAWNLSCERMVHRGQ